MNLRYREIIENIAFKGALALASESSSWLHGSAFASFTWSGSPAIGGLGSGIKFRNTYSIKLAP
jgi:hypothetical protein